MKTTQTRKPFLTPAARSRPQLFCRSTATGELLWSRDDGLPIHTNRDLKISFPDSCGFVEQSDGLISVNPSLSSTVFVHEYQGMILMMTHAGDLLTCDSYGDALAVHRNVFDQFFGAVGASGRTVWVKITSDDIDQLVAVDIINGIQSATSGYSVYAGPRADGSIIVSKGTAGSVQLASLNPDGSFRWGPNSYDTIEITNYSEDGTDGYWGSFTNGDMVTSKGVISWQTGAVIATWPPGDQRFGVQSQSVVMRLPNSVFSEEGIICALTWGKYWVVDPFDPSTGWWVDKIYRTIYDRNLDIVKNETFNDFIAQYIEANREEQLGDNVFLEDVFGLGEDVFGLGPEFYFDEIYYDGKLYTLLLANAYQFRVDLPMWFLSDLQYETGKENPDLLFYPGTSDLIGKWEDEINLPDPIIVTPKPTSFPNANKKRFTHSPIDYGHILRYSGGFFCHLAGGVLASFDSSGQLRWQVAIPNGPQQGTTNYVLSDDGSKIYYVN